MTSKKEHPVFTGNQMREAVQEPMGILATDYRSQKAETRQRDRRSRLHGTATITYGLVISTLRHDSFADCFGVPSMQLADVVLVNVKELLAAPSQQTGEDSIAVDHPHQYATAQGLL